MGGQQEEESKRVKITRASKKPVGFEIEQREDGHYYIAAVPSKKASINVGDRVVEINGVPASEFKNEKKANKLFEKLVMEVVEFDSDEEQDDLE